VNKRVLIGTGRLGADAVVGISAAFSESVRESILWPGYLFLKSI
jgi:hypothetical protein